MADKSAGMIADLETLVTSAVTEVFGTMLSLEARLSPPPANPDDWGADVAGSVGFTGPVTGVVYSYTSNRFARRITATLLGLLDSEIEGDEMVNDALGEVANMLVGYIKSRLCDRGLACVLTVPSVVRGRHLSVAAVSSTEKHVFHFQVENNHMLVEVHLKPNGKSG
jgi:chemotaxis protein CheX